MLYLRNSDKDKFRLGGEEWITKGILCQASGVISGCKYCGPTYRLSAGEREK